VQEYIIGYVSASILVLSALLLMLHDPHKDLTT
jgi:hypothetical protein